MSMRFEPIDLKEAALERVSTARLLFEENDKRGGNLSAAIYVAGVAVECMLRAYRMKRDPEFDSRHDLADLLRASGFVDFVPEKRIPEIAAALADVWSRWKNEYRHACDRRVSSDLKRRGLTDGIRCDQLKECARTVVERAFELVNVGAARWNSA